MTAVTVVAGALPAGYGPTSDGSAYQSPAVTGVGSPPAGYAALAGFPVPLALSGSPAYGPASNATGRAGDAEVAVTARLRVSVGTIHSGGLALAASGSWTVTRSCGRSGYLTYLASRGSRKTSSGAAPPLRTEIR